MKHPPYDPLSGEVLPHDHEDDDTDKLIRRINPEEHIVPDENRNCNRVSSKAFQPSSAPNGGMSVDIEKLILAAGLSPATYVVNPTFVGALQFAAGAARAVDLRIGYHPVAGNPHHGEVWGNNRPNRFSNSQKRALQSAATWLVAIPGVTIL